MRNLFNMDKSLSNSDLNSFGKINRKKNCPEATNIKSFTNKIYNQKQKFN